MSTGPGTVSHVIQDELTPLPEPGSPELAALISDSSTRAIYDFVASRADNPPTMVEIRQHMIATVGEIHSQVDRRLRNLREHGIDIPCIRIDKKPVYIIRGWRETGARASVRSISAKVEAQVLAPQMCAMCGDSPLKDGVKLVVDHKLPIDWGGTDDIDNLQPLCEYHNAGKKAFFATFSEDAEAIKAAATWPNPHVRIGELLKAFDGDWVPTELIGLVASQGAYQEDYQKRTRDLRYLGWNIRARRKKEHGRLRVAYRAEDWHDWPVPVEEVSALVRRIERDRAAARKIERDRAIGRTTPEVDPWQQWGSSSSPTGAPRTNEEHS